MELTPQDENLISELYEHAVGAVPAGTRGMLSARYLALMQKLNAARQQPNPSGSRPTNGKTTMENIDAARP